MNRLKFLQVKKLLKELEYIESDFEYRNEIINEADTEFIGKLNLFLDKHPDIKELYNKKIDITINQNILKNSQEIIDYIEEEMIDDITTEEEPKLPKVKKLYREIVKLTHPDRTDSKNLNEFYIQATKYYDNNDKLGIYRICSNLDIDYELDDEDNTIIEEKIDNLKRRIEFLESTFTWIWMKTEGDKDRTELMVDFIRLRIQ